MFVCLLVFAFWFFLLDNIFCVPDSQDDTFQLLLWWRVLWTTNAHQADCSLPWNCFRFYDKRGFHLWFMCQAMSLFDSLHVLRVLISLLIFIMNFCRSSLFYVCCFPVHGGQCRLFLVHDWIRWNIPLWCRFFLLTLEHHEQGYWMNSPGYQWPLMQQLIFALEPMLLESAASIALLMAVGMLRLKLLSWQFQSMCSLITTIKAIGVCCNQTRYHGSCDWTCYRWPDDSRQDGSFMHCFHVLGKKSQPPMQIAR